MSITIAGMSQPFYDPQKSYEENYQNGPFGAFADGQVYANLGEPTQHFLGQPVYVPFGIAAGPLLNAKFVKAALDIGFDLVVYKTVRTTEVAAHQWPNIVPVKTPSHLSLTTAQDGVTAADHYDVHAGITNSFGVPSAAWEVWQKDLAEAVHCAGKGQVVIGSFQGTRQEGMTQEEYITDYAEAARLTTETGVKVLEANLSCPNENTNRLLCFDPDTVKEIVLAIREQVGKIPLILKIAYFADQQELEHLVTEVGPFIDAISAINTIPAKVVRKNGQQALPGRGREISGVCGAPIHWAGLEMVERLAQLRKSLNLTFAIIGVGGVTDPAGFMRFRQAGADAVMCATGAMWNPFLAQEIKAHLREEKK